MPTITVLIVAKELFTAQLRRERVLGSDYKVLTASTVEEAVEKLKCNSVNIVITGPFEHGFGPPDWLNDVRVRHPEISVMRLSESVAPETAGSETRSDVENALRPSELRAQIERIVHSFEFEQRHPGGSRAATPVGFGRLIGTSHEMQRVYRLIGKVSQHSYPVLLLGESGTGKELVARSIHFSGPRRERPFVPVDCSALAPTLIESELFGYVKGAFTGAYRSKQGLIESARGGTLFLDEIGDLALDLQSKLLRIIQENEIRPIGSTERYEISMRVIAATNRNLEQLLCEGKFREDLYFRLNVVQVTLSPLRRRKTDIPLLASHFLEKFSGLGSQFSSISDDAMKHLLAYDWPGNVRELENAIARASALGAGPVLRTEDLPLNLQDRASKRECLDGEVVPLDELERRAILRAIREAGGDKTAAARILGIGKSTLYRRLRQFDKSRRRSPMDAESNHPSAS